MNSVPEVPRPQDGVVGEQKNNFCLFIYVTMVTSILLVCVKTASLLFPCLMYASEMFAQKHVVPSPDALCSYFPLAFWKGLHWCPLLLVLTLSDLNSVSTSHSHLLSLSHILIQMGRVILFWSREREKRGQRSISLRAQTFAGHSQNFLNCSRPATNVFGDDESRTDQHFEKREAKGRNTR